MITPTATETPVTRDIGTDPVPGDTIPMASLMPTLSSPDLRTLRVSKVHKFSGEVTYTVQWPDGSVDYTDKRSRSDWRTLVSDAQPRLSDVQQLFQREDVVARLVFPGGHTRWYPTRTLGEVLLAELAMLRHREPAAEVLVRSKAEVPPEELRRGYDVPYPPTESGLVARATYLWLTERMDAREDIERYKTRLLESERRGPRTVEPPKTIEIQGYTVWPYPPLDGIDAVLLAAATHANRIDADVWVDANGWVCVPPLGPDATICRVRLVATLPPPFDLDEVDKLYRAQWGNG